MPSNHDDFAERLRRIEQKRLATAPSGAPPPPRNPVPEPDLKRPRRRFGPSPLVIAVVMGIAVLGLSPVIGQMLGIDLTINAGAPSADSGLGSLIGRLDRGTKRPVDYIPSSPSGWVRVTIADAKSPDAYETLATNWPDGGFSLQENLGHKHLLAFLRDYSPTDLYRIPDYEARVMAQSQSRAIYLHPNGQFMNVGLKFLDKVNTMGAPQDKTAWIDALAAKEERNIDDNEILERTRLAGVDLVNRTKPLGASLLVHPIGDNLDIPTGMKLSVPVANRAVLSLQGMATPNDAAAIIAATDRVALLNHFD